MGIYEELVARGLIAQVTNEEEIREMVNNGKATFYIGFDPTADSLHVGHFMALCLMKRLQMAGNRPIALLGGGTGMIGDPSGKSDMRKMMTRETIQHNIDCFKVQMSRFIDFSEGKALNTIENIRNVRDLVKGGRVAIITSAFHIPRAAILAKRAGLNFAIFGVDWSVPDEATVWWEYWMPSVGALGEASMAIKELVAINFDRRGDSLAP
jgi:hypothetical protein